MAIRSSLNYRSLDSTWLMNTSSRQLFSVGVIEDTGLLSIYTPPIGLIQVAIAPFTAIGKDGVIVWDTFDGYADIPNVDGNYYVKLTVSRTETSGIGGVQFVVDTIAPDPSVGDICFGNIEVTTGYSVFNVTYEDRDSIIKATRSTGRFRGVIESADIPVSTDPDLKDGDTFIVSDAGDTDDAMFLYIWNAKASTPKWRVVTLRDVAEKMKLGVGSNAISLDGTLARIRVGVSSPRAVTIDGITGALTAYSANISSNIITSRLSVATLEAYSGTNITIGTTGSPNQSLTPYTTNLGQLGTASKYWGAINGKDLTIGSIILRPDYVGIAGATIGTLATPFTGAYSSLIRTNNIQSLSTSINVLSSLLPTPSVLTLGSAPSNYWGSVYSLNIYAQNLRSNALYLYLYNTIKPMDNIDLGDSTSAFKDVYISSDPVGAPTEGVAIGRWIAGDISELDIQPTGGAITISNEIMKFSIVGSTVFLQLGFRVTVTSPTPTILTIKLGGQTPNIDIKASSEFNQTIVKTAAMGGSYSSYRVYSISDTEIVVQNYSGDIETGFYSLNIWYEKV